jgi:hypothetical protein
MQQELPIIVQTNRVIREFAADTSDASQKWQFLCECGCFELVELTLDEFDVSAHVYARGHALEAVPDS